MRKSFFAESREQSQVKTAIVTKYFGAWANVMMSTCKRRSGGENKIAYIDLFAGPGRYEDGTVSTPLVVLEKAIHDVNLSQMLVTIFNDRDVENKRSLEKAISELPGVETLRYPPQVYCEEIGEQIIRKFEQMRLVPTLFFVDPWGYKGLSLQLVNSVLKDWGCDCIFFFNYNRINMGLTNPFVRDHMDALFGRQRADQLRRRLGSLSPDMRELGIVEEVCQALEEMGGSYVLPFRFKNERGTRTSHHLIFVSKHFKGYEIMKEIMAKESSKAVQGVASFGYSPAERHQQLLFELFRPLDDLAEMLLSEFTSRSLTVQEIYMQHNVGRQYVKGNYKRVLLELERAGTITVEPPLSQRRKGTIKDDAIVTFPPPKG